MHDLICNSDVEAFDCKDRNAVVTKFKMTLDHLNYVDRLLVHFENFSSNPQHYTLPDVLMNGLPVFHIPQYSTSTTPEQYIQDFSNQTFLHYWKPISSLELDVWHRWVHAHRIHILLNNDYPLNKVQSKTKSVLFRSDWYSIKTKLNIPCTANVLTKTAYKYFKWRFFFSQHLLLPNSSGRYFNVQARKAAITLTNCLKEWSTFVLLENSTYIKFIYPDNDNTKPPETFYIIRMASKPPCVILWLAFPGGTSGSIRHSVCTEVKDLILNLTIKQLQSWRDPGYYSNRRGLNLPESSELSAYPACVLFRKPVERILIRYDQQPSDFMNLLEPAFDSLNNTNNKLTRRIVSNFGSVVYERPSSGTFLTLSR